MARKRKRRLNPGPILLVLLVANVAAGLWKSPLTALSKVRVEGANREDHAFLTGQLQALKGRPFVRINASEVESRMMQLPDVKGASFSANPFGRGTLTLAYRSPVASIGDPPLGVDERGVIYPARSLPDALPRLVSEPGIKGLDLTIASSWPSGSLASLCRRLADFANGRKIAVSVDPVLGVCLNREGSGTVVLGSTDKLDRQLQVLRRMLVENPDLLEGVTALNLLDPEHPATKPKAVPPKP